MGNQSVVTVGPFSTKAKPETVTPRPEKATASRAVLGPWRNTRWFLPSSKNWEILVFQAAKFSSEFPSLSQIKTEEKFHE